MDELHCLPVLWPIIVLALFNCFASLLNQSFQLLCVSAYREDSSCHGMPFKLIFSQPGVVMAEIFLVLTDWYCKGKPNRSRFTHLYKDVWKCSLANL